MPLPSRSRCRSRFKLRIGDDRIPCRSESNRLVSGTLCSRRVPIQFRSGQEPVDGRGQRWVAPLWLLDRGHRFSDRRPTGNRRVFHVNDVAIVPDKILSQILTNPLPLHARLDRHHVRSIERAARQRHVAIDNGKDLHVAADTVPEHPVLDQHLGSPQHAAGTINVAQRAPDLVHFWISLPTRWHHSARGRAARPGAREAIPRRRARAPAGPPARRLGPRRQRR